MNRLAAVLIVMVAIAGGALLLAQTEPFNMDNTQPGTLGGDCSVFQSPGAVYVTSDGKLMRCDPDYSVWRLLPVEATSLSVRLEGFCENAGPDANDACYADSDCTNDAACSGAVCDCVPSDPIDLLGIYDNIRSGGSGTNFGSVMMQWDTSEASINMPYPSSSGTYASYLKINHYGSGCSGAVGCDVADFQYPTTTIGDSAKPGVSAGIQLLVYGDFSADGKGSGATRTAGTYNGTVNHAADGTSNPFQLYSSLTESGTVAKTTWDSTSDAFRLEWWDGAASSAQDFYLTRTAANTLDLVGGNHANTRWPIHAGDANITSGEFVSGAPMKTAGFGEDFSTGQGVTLPSDGSVVRASAMCEFGAGAFPTEQGKLRISIEINDSEVFTCDSSVILDEDNGPHYWSCSQARDTDTFSQNDWIDWNIVESPQGTCEEGSNEGTIDCTLSSECTGGASCDGPTCDCVTMTVGTSGECTTTVEVVFDD